MLDAAQRSLEKLVQLAGYFLLNVPMYTAETRSELPLGGVVIGQRFRTLSS